MHVYVPVHCGAPAVLYVPAGHSGFMLFTTSTKISHVSKRRTDGLAINISART